MGDGGDDTRLGIGMGVLGVLEVFSSRFMGGSGRAQFVLETMNTINHEIDSDLSRYAPKISFKDSRNVK